jgi:hypothetical protein
MTVRIEAAAPWPNPRITGVVYLLYFLTAICAVVLVRGLVSSDDAAATARDILAHEPLFRAGFAIGLIGTALYVAVTALFYGLFKRVNKSLALVATLFSLVGCTIQGASNIFQLAALVVLGGSRYLSSFTTDQQRALALLFLNLHAQSGYIEIVFFGLFDFAIGCLIFKSTFLPRTLGVLMAFAGLGWLTFLAPAFASQFAPVVDGLGFIAELCLMLWLIVMGVNVPRWKEQAGT